MTSHAQIAGSLMEKFPKWLSKPMGNKWFVYWQGFLARDRVTVERIDPNNPNSMFIEKPVPEVDALAKMIYASFKRGQVRLVQKREGPGKFIYFAVKRR